MFLITFITGVTAFVLTTEELLFVDYGPGFKILIILAVVGIGSLLWPILYLAFIVQFVRNRYPFKR